VGVGPGDPDLVTIGARKAIERADVVFIPISAEGRRSVAGEICMSFCSGRDARNFWFPMTNDAQKRDAEILRQLEELRPVWEGAQTVALPMIGDSVLYATVAYLFAVWTKICPGLELKLLPGISAHSLASSLAGEFIAMGDERLSVLPGSAEASRLAESMRASDCVALYKPSALGAALTELAESTGPWSKSVCVHHAGLEDQYTVSGADAILPTDDYLSVLLLWRDRR
jgi:precorrin-2/cobalt-factor-2 C20-methyltransferase